jgi:hypothetical protein
VELERLDLAKRDPTQLERLEVSDDGLKELVRLNGDRGVRPEPEVKHRLEQLGHRMWRHARLLIGFTERRRECRFVLTTRTTGQCPGTAVVRPLGTVLEKNAGFTMPAQQTGRTEATPKLGSVRTVNPRITRIALVSGWQVWGHRRTRTFAALVLVSIRRSAYSSIVTGHGYR